MLTSSISAQCALQKVLEPAKTFFCGKQKISSTLGIDEKNSLPFPVQLECGPNSFQQQPRATVNSQENTPTITDYFDTFQAIIFFTEHNKNE